MKRLPAMLFFLCACLWALSAATATDAFGRWMGALCCALYVASAILNWRAAK